MGGMLKTCERCAGIGYVKVEDFNQVDEIEEAVSCLEASSFKTEAKKRGRPARNA